MMVVFRTWSSPEAIVIRDLIPLPEMKPGQKFVQKSSGTGDRRQPDDRPQETPCRETERTNRFACSSSARLRLRRWRSLEECPDGGPKLPFEDGRKPAGMLFALASVANPSRCVNGR